MILLFIISILVFIYLCYVLVKPENSTTITKTCMQTINDTNL